MLESLVLSGLSSISEETKTKTGLERLMDCKKPDRTDINRFRVVLVSFLQLKTSLDQSQSQPVTNWSGPVFAEETLGFVTNLYSYLPKPTLGLHCYDFYSFTHSFSLNYTLDLIL